MVQGVRLFVLCGCCCISFTVIIIHNIRHKCNRHIIQILSTNTTAFLSIIY
nr:MAG TPA: hypothetical protein [Bacteriophage sp.]